MTSGYLSVTDATQAHHNFLQFLLYRQAFVEERHPHLWVNLYRGYKEANLPMLKAGFEQKSLQFGGVYDVLTSQPNLLTELNFKTLDLETILPPEMRSFYLNTLKRAIKLQAEHAIGWTTKEYDYTITLKHQEGFYKGWVHQYWPGTCNGNVWLIINPTTDIFYLVS